MDDESEGFAGATLICRNWFDVARDVNARA
jgi:hypothetical protein